MSLWFVAQKRIKKGRSKGLKTPNYLFSKYIRDNKLAFSC
jgi:hypothetical protein